MQHQKRLTIGIDASRNRSGGAKTHLVGILTESDPTNEGISTVHVWSYKELLDALPDLPWLQKHNPALLERSLFHQLWWQFFRLPKEAHALGCDALLNTDAGTICPFRPSATMSRDMLSYEPGEMKRYGLSLARLRLFVLKYVQARSLRHATGAVFLTKYAAKLIQNFTGPLSCPTVIPHGVSNSFKQSTHFGNWSEGKAIRCLYVSNAAFYKHQWVVIKAIEELRTRGHNVSLTLAGGGRGAALRRMHDAIEDSDPNRKFIKTIEQVAHEEVPTLLADADLFIFASSCENMPNTLVEAMASGLPIACSDRGPMPEVLQDGGVFFDPEDFTSIADAVEKVLLDKELRIRIAHRAKELSEDYSWGKCGRETWKFLRVCAKA